MYVDGFNLFYAALSGSHFKWLDLFSLFQDRVLDAEAKVEHVRYYTAPIKASAADDPHAPIRQQRYLRALRAYRPAQITICEGFIQRTSPRLRLAEPIQGLRAGELVKVLQFTEKQTDVNLAVDLLSDAWRGLMDQAVICSNDSDLAGALQALRRDHPALRIGLVAPIGDARYVSTDLKRHAHWHKVLGPAHLAAAQLPDQVPGTPLTRPSEWE
ncbi:MAG: NYN domain-containing protein [Nevskia sp.]|nr:NYN domain-containing protein [Nevskia sp.]